MQEDPIQSNLPSTAKQVLRIVNQVVLWGLIITYCVLSQSLFSAIALVFLIVSLILTIARPYRIVQPSQLSSPQNRKVTAYPAQRIVWTLFSCLNIAFLAGKVVIYFSFSQGLGEDDKEFL